MSNQQVYFCKVFAYRFLIINVSLWSLNSHFLNLFCNLGLIFRLEWSTVCMKTGKSVEENVCVETDSWLVLLQIQTIKGRMHDGSEPGKLDQIHVFLPRKVFRRLKAIRGADGALLVPAGRVTSPAMRNWPESTAVSMGKISWRNN